MHIDNPSAIPNQGEKMSKPRIIFRRFFQFTALKPSSSNPEIIHSFRSRSSISPTTHLSSSPNIMRIFDRQYTDADFSRNGDFLGFRCCSLKIEMDSNNSAKDEVENPVVAVKDTFLWYKETFWKRNHLVCCVKLLPSNTPYVVLTKQLTRTKLAKPRRGIAMLEGLGFAVDHEPSIDVIESDCQNFVQLVDGIGPTSLFFCFQCYSCVIR